ncbi:hypothetical protein EV196_101551 [Mariniflexile fucanivorans]|uniref:Uncharacterized protein n=1 Tax=Mariniflexile fucanivorans TaxID=264023 RepID=A0A4R1RS38_9FLAO|nr:hypothetical protein [Mariniflexile fucanivorans]TCL69119.1 hypothetical protein EV196_101551 [Mariniflexile fucanivorans]
MKISLIFISTILVLSVVLPFLLFVYNGAKNTVSVKKQAEAIIKGNGLVYSLKEVWRKNFIGISTDNKAITHIKFNSDKSKTINDINLIEVKACNIIKSYQNGANKSQSLKSLALEFIYKTSGKPNTIVSFFDVDDDLTEDFELQRIEKWQALIKNAIIAQPNLKLAS